jgi:hypothetical protein
MIKPPWSRAHDRFADTEPASTLPMIPPGEESAYADTAPMPLANVPGVPLPSPPLVGSAGISFLDEAGWDSLG